MKNFHSGLMCLFISALFFLPVAKMRVNLLIKQNQKELISLSLNISLLDFEKKSLTKQEVDDFPECSCRTPHSILKFV